MTISETFEEMFRKRFGRSPTQEELTVLIDQSVRSYNQSGGVTAHTVNLGPQPRQMSDALKKEILKNIPRLHPIVVMALMGDAESLSFAQEIHAYLKANGFPLSEDGVSQGVFNAPQKGLSFDQTKSMLIVGTNMS